MDNQSVWQSFSLDTDFPELGEDITADIVIIGGGITGITAAQLLKESGKKVVVLESQKIGVSNTGNSTGNLYEVMGKELVEIRKKYPAKTVQMILNSRRAGMELIEENIRKFGIDCDYIRVPWYYYTASSHMENYIEKNYEACREAGLDMSYADSPHPALVMKKAIRLENQAQFNPLRYVQDLANKIADDSCLIFEHSMVRDVENHDDKVVVKTDRGSVTGSFVIHATHTPKGVSAYHTLVEPYREYGIACKIEDPQHPHGIYFGYYDSSSIYSTRFYEHKGEKYLIVVGSPHKVGHDSTEEHMQELIKFAESRFKILEHTHTWGGQHYRPADEIPYIGKKPGSDSRVYIATGFSTHGLVYGTLAAEIITDAINGVENEYASLYSATRFTPMKSAKKFVKENATVFYDLVKDYLRRDKHAFDEVAPGEGKLIEHDGHRLAVYRNEIHQLSVCSAVCTHMGCLVRWNDHETSWDCPCHGSRFDTSGEVIEGPALYALPKVELNDEEAEPKADVLKIIRDNLETGQDYA
jgi:glycine/D-amino acid oxidase-like deaminating enzyme/nitrite reductase/ring-hydroxylating ferredoxin subunit